MLLTCGVGEDPESPLDCNEVQPFHPKWDQSWVFIGRTDVEADSNTLATWCKELIHLKRPWCWERLRAGDENDRGWDGWMASPTQWTWVWVNSGSWWWTGRPGVLRFMESQRVGHDSGNELNWTESAYKLNKQSDNKQPWHVPFPVWNQAIVPCLVLTVSSWLHTGFSWGR